MKNRSSPYALKRKIVRENGKHCIKEVYRDGWRTIVECETREQALIEIEAFHKNKDAKWALEVKIRAGWVCEECGELDVDMLEAHHIKPRSIHPELAHEPDNGKCVCIWCHAFEHKGITRDHILARLAIKLYGRLYPEKVQEKIQEEAKKADRPAEAFC